MRLRLLFQSIFAISLEIVLFLEAFMSICIKLDRFGKSLYTFAKIREKSQKIPKIPKKFRKFRKNSENSEKIPKNSQFLQNSDLNTEISDLGLKMSKKIF